MSLSLHELQPFTLSLSKSPFEMSRSEAVAQFDELMRVLPERLDYFKNVLISEGVSLGRSSTEALDNAGDFIASKGKLSQ